MEATQQSFSRQKNAGVMLYKIKPQAKLEPLEMLRLCLPTWNVSVEELIFYFVEKCGKKDMELALRQLKLSALSERELAALESMQYWFEKHES